MMNIDVLIPCAGDAAYVRESIASVLAQTLSPRRVYILDNACAHDRYRQVVAGFDDPRLEYVRFPRRLPMVENWQRCLHVGDSTFCAFLHDDDLWRPLYLEAAHSRLDAGSAEAVLFGCEHFVGDREPNEIVTPWDFEKLDVGNDPVAKLILATSCLGHMSSLVFKRGTGSFRLSAFVAADQFFVDQFLMRGTLVLHPGCDVLIRDHPSSLSSAHRRGRWSVELIDRTTENLIALCRPNLPSEAEASKFAQLKGRAAYSHLMISCYGKVQPPVFLPARRVLMDRKKWRGASGEFTSLGKCLFKAPHLVAVALSRLMYSRYMRRDK